MYEITDSWKTRPLECVNVPPTTQLQPLPRYFMPYSLFLLAQHLKTRSVMTLLGTQKEGNLHGVTFAPTVQLQPLSCYYLLHVSSCPQLTSGLNTRPVRSALSTEMIGKVHKLHQSNLYTALHHNPRHSESHLEPAHETGLICPLH